MARLQDPDPPRGPQALPQGHEVGLVLRASSQCLYSPDEDTKKLEPQSYLSEQGLKKIKEKSSFLVLNPVLYHTP